MLFRQGRPFVRVDRDAGGEPWARCAEAGFSNRRLEGSISVEAMPNLSLRSCQCGAWWQVPKAQWGALGLPVGTLGQSLQPCAIYIAQEPITSTGPSFEALKDPPRRHLAVVGSGKRSELGAGLLDLAPCVPAEPPDSQAGGWASTCL